MSDEPTTTPPLESPIGAVRGTRDWLPGEFARLAALEALLLDRFARAGYEPMRTPVLEPTELHERKSGAGIVARLYGVAGGDARRLCLRPELTAGIVRAYTATPEPPPLPWRVSLAGPVFRHETLRPGFDREFQQVGVELLGASGPAADGEIIWLADWALAEAGARGATIRLGHVGLILEMLRRSGLPASVQAALVEMLSEAATEGRNVRALELGLEGLAHWLQGADPGEIPLAVEGADDRGIDRLFRTLVPVVTGRRSGHEILHRLRRKWDLGHSLLGVLDRVRAQAHELADLRGPVFEVLKRLGRDYESSAPESIAALSDLVGFLFHYGVDLDRVELDLGFGRGIGFYSQMVFELVVPTPKGPVEVCGGGRYDGLARVLGSDRDDRGVGFAFGLERLLGALPAGEPGPREVSGFLVVAQPPGGETGAASLARYLRTLGQRAVLETGRRGDEAAAHARALGLAWVIGLVAPPEERDCLVVRGAFRAEESRASLNAGDLARFFGGEAVP
jgi:histidyl-tRNA synthetase